MMTTKYDQINALKAMIANRILHILSSISLLFSLPVFSTFSTKVHVLFKQKKGLVSIQKVFRSFWFQVVPSKFQFLGLMRPETISKWPELKPVTFAAKRIFSKFAIFIPSHWSLFFFYSNFFTAIPKRKIQKIQSINSFVLVQFDC